MIQITAAISSRTILPNVFYTLIIIIPTIITGRLFCGYVCPLGLLVEIFSYLLKPVSRSRHLRNLKYYHLIIIIILACFGFYGGHLDPIATLTRGIGIVKHPGTFLPIVIVLSILFLSAIEERFFCRNICPLGGLLGVISKISIFKLKMTECKECHVCEKVCPTGAIEGQNVRFAECIVCQKCIDRCPDGSIGFRIEPKSETLDLSRRGFITSFASSLLLLPLFRSKRLAIIRPPGSVPEDLFLERCARCGACINGCPTGGLQFDLLSFLTPKLVSRVGGCERYCNRCGQICPTHVIRNLPISEKEFAKIGTAIIDRNRCLAWRHNQSCLVCDEACPYGAIYFRISEFEGIKMGRPIVDRKLCIGCGLCESRCPLAGPSAIVVYPEGEERKQSGVYRTKEKVLLRQKALEAEEEIPEGFIK